MTDTAPLARLLDHTPSITLAVLFGSAGRGVDGPRSDVDIGVLFASDAARREGATALGVALERACGRPVDLVTLNDAPPLLRFEIARHAVVLVERSPHIWSDFRVQAALDWWDWAPTARRMHAAAVSRVRARVRGATMCTETPFSGDASGSPLPTFWRVAMVQRDVAGAKIARATTWLDDADARLGADAAVFVSDRDRRDLAIFYLFLAIQECIDLAVF